MSTVQLDENGNRVIIRHTGVPGPTGPGVPEGGDDGNFLVKVGTVDFETAWKSPDEVLGFVSGPASSVNTEVVLFDGSTGKLLRGSGIPVNQLATKSMLENVTEENFTTETKLLLQAMFTAMPAHYNHFRGVFATQELLDDAPGPVYGDYAFLATALMFYDGSSWKDISEFVANAEGATIADNLFEDGESWTKANSYIFTSTYRAMIDSHESLIQTLNGSVTATAAIRSVASDWTVVPADRTILFAPAGGVTLICTLPVASLHVGRILVIKCLGGALSSVDVTPAGTETIDSVAGAHNVPTGQSVTLQSSGSGWIII